MLISIVKTFNIKSISDLYCFCTYHGLFPRINPDLKVTAKPALRNVLLFSAKRKQAPVFLRIFLALFVHMSYLHYLTLNYMN